MEKLTPHEIDDVLSALRRCNQAEKELPATLFIEAESQSARTVFTYCRIIWKSLLPFSRMNFVTLSVGPFAEESEQWLFETVSESLVAQPAYPGGFAFAPSDEVRAIGVFALALLAGIDFVCLCKPSDVLIEGSHDGGLYLSNVTPGLEQHLAGLGLLSSLSSGSEKTRDDLGGK